MTSVHATKRNASLLLLAIVIVAILAGLDWLGPIGSGGTPDSDPDASHSERTAAVLSPPGVSSEREALRPADLASESPSLEPSDRLAAVDHAATLFRVQFVFADTLEPVPDVAGALTLHFQSGASRRLEILADEHGSFAVADPGQPLTWFRVIARGQTILFSVGEPEDCTLKLERSIRVSGQVLDRHGRGARGSEVLILKHEHVELATTDRSGRFDLPFVAYGSKLLARREGSLESKPYVVESSEPIRSLELRLLTGDAKSLSGRVSDERGVAIAHARIEFCEGESYGLASHGVGAFLQDQAIVARSNAEGEYRFPGVAAGFGWLRVSATGFITHDVNVSVQEDTKRDIQLAPSAVVFGRVVTSSEHGVLEPVEHAGVYVEPADQDAFTSWGSRSDAEGYFVVLGIEPGPVSIGATSRLGGADVELELVPGEWRTGVVLKVGASRSVAGVLTNEDGLPLSNWEIGVGTNRNNMEGRTTTDENGVFQVFVSQTAAPLQLFVMTPALRQFAWTQGPGRAEELGGAIAVPSTNLPSAFLVGRVLLGKSAAENAVIDVVAVTDRGRWSVPTTMGDRDGAFRVGPLIPGSFVLDLDADRALPMKIGPIELHTDQVRDLGDNRLEHAASVHVEFEGDDVPLVLEIRFFKPEGSARPALISHMVNGALKVSELEPGTYSVEAWSRRKQLAVARFTAAVGVEARAILWSDD